MSLTVFVEGAPRSGKSTIATVIAKSLKAEGLDVYIDYSDENMRDLLTTQGARMDEMRKRGLKITVKCLQKYEAM